MRRARLRKARIDAVVGRHIHFAENAADIGRHRFALFRLQVEDRDLHALGGKRTRGRLAKAGGAAGDDGGNG